MSDGQTSSGSGIRNHFPEEHIPDGRPGRKPIPTRRVFEAVFVDTQYRRAVARAAAKLSELQIRSSALSNLVQR
jgi:hypothetical protein